MTQFLFVNQLLFIGTTELLLIGGIALLLFGGKKLPEIMRGIGQGVKEFKKGMNDDSETPTNVNEERTQETEEKEQVEEVESSTENFQTNERK